MNLISLIFILSSAVTLLLAVYSFRQKKTPGALSFAGLLLSGAIYSFGYAFEIRSETLQELNFWHFFEYFGIPFIAPTWFMFAAQFTNNHKYLTKPVVYGIFTFAFLTFFIRLTNDLHHWFYTDVSILKVGSLTIAQYENAFWYYLHIAVINISIFISSAFFLKMIKNSKGYLKMQAKIMFLASIVLYLFFVVYITGYSPYNIDASPFGFSVVGIILAWGMFYYRLLNIVPFAFENVFSSLKEMIILLDSKGILINYNPAAAELINYYTHSDGSRNLNNDFGELSRTLKPLISGEKENVFFSFKTEGRQRELHAAISKVNDKKDSFVGYSIIINDLTDQKKNEILLRKNEEKFLEVAAQREKFYRILAHDLKTPFSSIIPMAQILNEEAYEISRDELKQLAESIQSAADGGYKLLLELLEWAKLQSGKMEFSTENVNIYSSANECISFLKETAKSKLIMINLEISQSLEICTDKNVFSTVLRNLLNNAIKFSYSGMEIIVKADDLGNKIRVSVRDFGVGISEEDQKKIFKPDNFYTTLGTSKEKGTGIGLQLAREMLEHIDGSIHVDSALGKGSEFYFYLPRN